LLHLGQEDLPSGLLALAQAFSVAERQLHGLLLNMRRVVSRIYGALFRGSLELQPGLTPNFERQPG
ncbi:hypothetical protein, partial [Xanthomonas hortorum]|uniref:hypothetical protein n=1 Tax=Xanthomonas hortorum TaxID=56454 RepID=UPI001C3C8C53